MVRSLRPVTIMSRPDNEQVIWWQTDQWGNKISNDYSVPSVITESHSYMIPNRAIGARYSPGYVLPSGEVIGYGQTKYGRRREISHRFYFCDRATVSGGIRATNGWTGFSPEYRSPYDPYGDLQGMLLDFEYSVPDWDAAIETAVANLRNQFSLINFILEMDEIPRLFDRCRTACELYLRGQFGALPLIADLESFFLYQLQADDLLASTIVKLREGAQFGRRLKSTQRVTKRLHRAGREFELTLHGEVTQAISGVVRGHVETNAWRTYADMIGLYPDLSTLWNAVPFSFILDYFVPVGRALARQDEGWNRRFMAIDPGTAMVSTKFDGWFTVKCIDVPGCTQHPEIGVVTHRGRFKDYVRVFALDTPLDGIDVVATAPNLRPRQMTNLAALARESTRRRRRPFQVGL